MVTSMAVASSSSGPGPEASAAASTSQPPMILPLTVSLQKTLSLLFQRLAKMITYQAQLQSMPQASHVKLTTLPGTKALVEAAQKWQRDVMALNNWVNSARDALTIELDRAKIREAEQAKKAAEEAAAQAARAAAAPAKEPAIDIKTKGQTDSLQATEASVQKGKVEAEDASKVQPRPGEGKRSREESATAQDGAEPLKRPKLEGGEAATVEMQSSMPAPTGEAGISNPTDLFAALAASGGGLGAASLSQQGPDGAAFTPGDASASGLPDLSNMDFSAFMGGLGDGNTGGAVDMGGDATTFDGQSSGAFGGGDDWNTGYGNLTGFDSRDGMEGLDAQFGGMGNMDLGAALEGVDWSSLLNTIGSGGDGEGGGQ